MLGILAIGLTLATCTPDPANGCWAYEFSSTQDGYQVTLTISPRCPSPAVAAAGIERTIPSRCDSSGTSILPAGFVPLKPFPEPTVIQTIDPGHVGGLSYRYRPAFFDSLGNRLIGASVCELSDVEFCAPDPTVYQYNPSTGGYYLGRGHVSVTGTSDIYSFDPCRPGCELIHQGLMRSGSAVDLNILASSGGAYELWGMPDQLCDTLAASTVTFAIPATCTVASERGSWGTLKQ